MSGFLALALTDERFRKVLASLDKPNVKITRPGVLANRSALTRDEMPGLDGILDHTADKMMDRMHRLLAGERRGDANVQAAIDALTVNMLANVGDQRSYIEQRAEGSLARLEKMSADAIQALSQGMIDKARPFLASNSRAVRAGASAVSLVGTMINEESATEAQLGWVSKFNQRGGLESARALLNDLVGRTRENAPIMDMVSKVRALVQQTRQQFRDELPVKLEKAFSRKVSQAEWTAMFKALGKTDIAALTGSYGLNGALEFLTDSRRVTAEIQNLELSIQSMDARRFARIRTKSHQLANYMTTGQQGLKLLRNAEAIARLLGEQNYIQMILPNPQLVQEIDKLVSLYAIQMLDQQSRDTMLELFRTDKDRAGVEFVTSYLMGQRKDELAKVAGNTTALFNHYKGYIPSEAQQGGSLIIASDSEHAKLTLRGYVHVGAYTGSSADRVLGRRSYYFSPVSGTAPFSQGVMQTVHQTASGIDPETGYTMDEVMAGRIEDEQVVRLIESQLHNQRQTSEQLLPVYDNRGKVVAYERAADPAV